MSSSSFCFESVLSLILKDQPLSDALKHYGYGTAGFRFKASIMDGLMVRVGLLSILLLLETPSSEDMGIMITASHNDESYNGVKLARPDGSMLTPSQEDFLTAWVNENDAEKWKRLLEDKTESLRTNQPCSDSERTLHLGRDTRIHSPHLSLLCCQGAQACVDALAVNSNVRILDHGVLTTPMLHHIVLHSNPQYLPSYITPRPSRNGYIQTFAEAYVYLMKHGESVGGGTTINALYVDGACGVGHQAVKELTLAIQDLLEENDGQSGSLIGTVISAHNGPGDGPLNLDCGSEHVQKQLLPPIWYDGTPTTTLDYCCALDGDADRIVFFGQDTASPSTVSKGDEDGDVETPKGQLTHLLDGDKIAILIAHVLKEKLNDVPDGSPTMGIVQTAYANGASTKYVESTLNLPVKVAKTGVKHLHHAAVENFDIGIYFEANGHGTVVFSKAFEEFAIKQQQNCNNSFFVKLHQLINPAVGDALCDMLLVDFLLKSALGGWTLQQWNDMYQDLPSRMLKVKVQDRSIIRCNDNETECIEPDTVQPLLQQAMSTVNQGRTFIRPSGTEDVVRVYAEAATREEADTLAALAAQIVYDTCNGVGDRPSASSF
ncbi:phosphoglucosamine mutase [Nitzschia inconspicua]|uniref:Phosphoglucosamine mutase n=1 Tax=Nitzschia inconspicua TaxID=303405 RepID=A0A9K3LCU7_9STRA|nr:phosphoglucosamine mutase [Nitzschia inconspicua]